MSVPETPGIPRDPDTPTELRARIEHTRRELGDTLEELAAKADLKSRAQQKASEAMRTGRSKARPLAMAAGGVVLALGLAAALVLYRRQQGHH
ncbi:MAG TPA: DUF3618 domain-containing protein [Streptomyces sp.]|uniref:DUF3618 domain-containing protein n=1 Tax=Streptomyces sp. TaxID=1931 RepID=UPI002D5191AD|nr:DUF3618 domain-containing protein [Streptomyces sp.]HZG06956.1 DUF3618 domain-containing protein [Streptomyces sp.]